MNTAMPGRVAALDEIQLEAASLPFEGPSFDAQGVPLNAAAAFSMTAVQIADAVASLVAKIEHSSVPEVLSRTSGSPNGTALVDSVIAVSVFAKFSAAFGPKGKLINLSKISDPDWSNIGSVTRLLADAIGKKRSEAVAA